MKRSVYLSGLLAFCFSFLAIVAKAQPVVTNPVNDTTCVMDTAWFSVTATGTAPFTYQWNWSDDGGMTWDTVLNGGIYANATTNTLRIIPTNTMENGYWYRSIVFNTSGSDTSDWAMLSVDTAYAGAISGMTPVCVGSTIALTSSVPGGAWSNVDHAIDTVDPSGLLEGRAFGTDTIRYTVMNTCGTSVSEAYSRVDTVAITYPVTGPNHVCVGGVITLANINTIGTGSWSSATGNTSPAATGHITGLSAGTDVITYTFTNACNTVSSSRAVTVEVLPAAGTITPSIEPPTFCSGTWMSFSSSTSGGVWISGNTSVAVVSSAGFVTGVGRGTSIISYYKSNSCGSIFAADTVLVETVADIIGGNDSVGIDSTILLTNATPGGSWTSADTTIAKLISGSSSGLVKGLDTGVTTITYAVTNTCGFSTATTPMHVGPLPNAGTISGPDSVCVGTSITLRASVAGGTWANRIDTLATVAPTSPATDTTTLVNGLKYGRDTVWYTVTTAFGKSVIKKNIFVNEPPQVYVTGPGAVFLTGAYDVKGFPAGGAWSTSNFSMTPITATFNISDSAKTKTVAAFVVMDTGTSTFTYVATNTCGTTTRTFTVHLPGGVSGVQNTPSGYTMNLYPNPSQGALVLSVAGAAGEKVQVAVSNIAGRVVKTLSATTNSKTEFTLDEPAGVYLVTATMANGEKQTARVTINN